MIAAIVAIMPLASCSDNEPDSSVTVNLVNAQFSYNSDGEWEDALNTELTAVTCQGVNFSHAAYSSSWGTYWSGFCASRVSDVADYTAEGTWTSHQFASMTGGGVSGKGTPYIVGYWNCTEGEAPTDPSLTISLASGDPFTVNSVYVNNTTYAYYTMLDGSSYSKVFADGDWQTVSFYGVTTSGKIVGPVDYYLADYRDGKQEITKDWTLVDLSALNASGTLKYVYLQMASSDTGTWGMNTPAYVALDRLKLTPAE